MDIGIHVVELLVGDVNVYAAQHGDGVRHRLPVEGHIVFNVEVQVLVESQHRLLRSAVRIGLVDLRIAVVLAEVQIGITVDGNHLHVAAGTIDIHNDLHIRIGSLAHRAVPGVHAEHHQGPVAGCHLLLLADVNVAVLHLFLIEGNVVLHQAHVTGGKAHHADGNEG